MYVYIKITYSLWKVQRLACFRYCLRGLRIISKIFITMEVSLGVPLLVLCLVTIAAF